MAADRVPTGVPGADLPEVTGQLQGPRPDQAPAALAWRLQGVVDRVRRLPSKLGVRRHRVYLVHLQWTGAERGEGQQVEVSRREIVPPPRVRGIDSVRRVVEPTGTIEQGDLVIDQISAASFSEDDLMGRTPDLQDPVLQRTSKRNVDFFYEVVELTPQRPPPAPRRFSPPVAVPELQRDGFGWRVTLTRQDYDRGRRGGYQRGDF